jgi:hypothetical protein
VYEDYVEIIVYSRINEVEDIISRMTEITSATAKLKLGEEFYLSEEKGKIIL